jgi:hypothetical protein
MNNWQAIQNAQLKGIVSRDGLLTETIGVKFRPKQSAAYLFELSYIFAARLLL